MNSLVPGVLLFTVLILLLALVVSRLKNWLLPSQPITLTINEQPGAQVSSGTKLLDALLGLDIPVPSGCAGAGTCGLCKVSVIKGGGPVLPTEAARLSKDDYQNQRRLACQVTLRNDLSIQVPEQILQAEHRSATVRSVISLSPLIREITLDMPADKLLEFHPGAYIQVTSAPYKHQFSEISISDKERKLWDSSGVSELTAGSKEPATRAYSLANRPDDKDSLVLLIRLALPPPSQMRSTPAGVVSSWLFSRRVGDQLQISGPYGDFRLHKNDREMVLVGGGVGMAPLRSLIHHELASDRSRPVSFFYGARSEIDVLYREEFDQLSQTHNRFNWTAVLSEPAPEDSWNGPVGFIHTELKQKFLDGHSHPERSDYYLCGPPVMQRAVLAVLDDAGVDLSRVYADVFGD